MVSDFSPARHSATTPRVSMAVGIRRWLVMRCLTTTSASRKACSVSPPSWWKVKAMLSGHSGWTAGAPAARAFSGSATAGGGLVIHFDQVGRVAAM